MRVDIEIDGIVVTFHYTISTPTNANTPAIDKSLPVVLFLHPVYIASEIFQPQFACAKLRRFNLVALDQRGHGETVGPVPSSWSRVEAAADVVRFLDALNIEACHVVGVSMGCCVGLQTAIDYPERVLSLFDISPLPLEEPLDVAEGRTEIYRGFAEGLADPDNIDDEAVCFACEGSLQLGFNNRKSPLIDALVDQTVAHARAEWSGSKLDCLYRISVQFFIHRKRHPKESLVKIRCPILLCHCGRDVAYDVSGTREFQGLLDEAGVTTQFLVVPDAAHFGNITNPDEINEALHEFLLSQCTEEMIYPSPNQVTSPFESKLSRYGWRPGSVTDDDDYEDEDGMDELYSGFGITQNVQALTIH